MDVDDLIPSWERSLKARNKANATIVAYTRAARRFSRWVGGADVQDIDRSQIQDYIAEMVRTREASTAQVNFKYLQQFFNWLVGEDEIDASPMRGLKPPDVPEKLVPVIAESDLVLLIKACDGRRFEDRRDVAIVRFFLDTGVRLGGLLSMTVDDTDLYAQRARIVLKGRRDHIVPFGSKTADAIDRYERVRRRHRYASQKALWIGQRGPLGNEGIERLVASRARRAGLGHIHPHQFRHTNADTWLANGGQETDLMNLMGWKSREMLGRYGRSAAQQRAREAHRRMGLGDRL